MPVGDGKPAKPPTPMNRNLPFQFSGRLNWKSAEPFGAPNPVVLTKPDTEQKAGVGGFAGTDTAESTVTPGTRFDSAAIVQGRLAEAGAAASMPPARAPRPMIGVSSNRPLRANSSRLFIMLSSMIMTAPPLAPSAGGRQW